MFARYYNSATGRFLSPDWDAKSSDPVPYAKLDNPQSLNLYSYVYNNPLGKADADGHGPPDASEELDLLDGKGGSPEQREENRIETALEPVEYVPPPSILPPPTPLQQAVQIIFHGGPVEQAIEKSVDRTFDQARKEAFQKAGMTDPKDVKFTEQDVKTGTIVEFKGANGAKVAYDEPHSTPGPGHDSPHVGFQSAGKRGAGGAKRGNLPYSGSQHPSRSPVKGESDVEPH